MIRLKLSLIFITFFGLTGTSQNLFSINNLGSINDFHFDHQISDSIDLRYVYDEYYISKFRLFNDSALIYIPLNFDKNYCFEDVSLIYNCLKIADTIIINDSIYRIDNPYPGIYGVKKRVYFSNIDSTETYFSYAYTGIPHYSFFTNGNVKSAPFSNNIYGSSKIFFDEKMRVRCIGTYMNNEQNGFWYYYKRGKLVRTEFYELGKLIK